jgi:hypothetical protein
LLPFSARTHLTLVNVTPESSLNGPRNGHILKTNVIQDLILSNVTPLTPLPFKRSTLLHYGVRVACWPSAGGIWINQVPPIEMGFLQLSHTNDTERPPAKTYYYSRTCPPDSEKDTFAPPDIDEEDLFCQKMQMVSADFWDLPPEDSLHGIPIELAIEPKHRNHLGFWWPNSRQPSIVNLTEARLYYGPSLLGYNDVVRLHDRKDIVQDLGGFSCGVELDKCEQMWCRQYPENCDEIDRLHSISRVFNYWKMYEWRGAQFQTYLYPY